MIIAFYGPKGCGKDTAAQLFRLATILMHAEKMGQEGMLNPIRFSHKNLSEYLNNQFSALDDDRIVSIFSLPKLADKIKVHSFSSYIHKVLSLILGEEINGNTSREKKDKAVNVFLKTNRQSLIDIGEGLREKLSADVWVVPTMRDICLNFSGINIVAGFRHYNEYCAMMNSGQTFFAVKMTNPKVQFIRDGLSAEGNLDDILQFNYVLENNGQNLFEFWCQIVNFIFDREINRMQL